MWHNLRLGYNAISQFNRTKTHKFPSTALQSPKSLLVNVKPAGLALPEINIEADVHVISPMLVFRSPVMSLLLSFVNPTAFLRWYIWAGQ